MNQYFADLDDAQERGIVARGHRPKKAELYALIAARELEASTASKVGDKKAKLAQRRLETKCFNRAEVWPADRIKAASRGSNLGRVLERTFIDGGINLNTGLAMGLSKIQFVQSIRAISELGYGINIADEQYNLVLPEGMTAPRFR